MSIYFTLQKIPTYINSIYMHANISVRKTRRQQQEQPEINKKKRLDNLQQSILRLHKMKTPNII